MSAGRFIPATWYTGGMKNRTIAIAAVVALAAGIAGGTYYFRERSGAQENLVENGPRGSISTVDFSIDLPAGWEQATTTEGISVKAINAGETTDDPAAQKINFKTYFAVAYEPLGERTMDHYYTIFKDYLSSIIPSARFPKEQDIQLNNGELAHAIEIELTQDDIDLKTLSVMTRGQGNDVWVISFNTAQENWGVYGELFYSVAKSFSLKK